MSDAEVDQWATLDELLGLEAIAEAPAAGGGIGRLAFYGRCSTEDNQDPRTSHAWQLGEAARFVEPLGGEIVAEYFDIGESRSLPWERRGKASLVLSALKDRLSSADILAMVKELGAMKAVLDQADRGDLADLYGALGLEVSYSHGTRVADVSISPTPRVVSMRVRGGTRTLTTCLQLGV